jgi:hypothetical protein
LESNELSLHQTQGGSRAHIGVSTLLLSQELQHCQHPPVLALTWLQAQLGEHVSYVALDGFPGSGSSGARHARELGHS